MVDFVHSLVPANSLEWVVIVVGAFVGMVFALDWKVAQESRERGQRPEIEEPAIFCRRLYRRPDRRLAENCRNRRPDFQAPDYGVLYHTVSAGDAWFISVHEWRHILAVASDSAQGSTRLPGSPFNPILEYLHYGYAHYQEEYTKQLAEKREACQRKLNNIHKGQSDRLRASMKKASAALAASIVAVEQCTDSHTADLVARRLLEYVCLIAESYIEESGSINANYMLAVPYATEQRGRLRYGVGDTTQYEFLLVLQAYAKQEGIERFALPVGPKRAGWENSALPGAPTAFLKTEPMVVNTEKLNFGEGCAERDTKRNMRLFRNQKV